MSWIEDALREDLNKRAAPRHGRLPSAQGRDRELSRRPDRGDWTRSTIPRTPPPARARCRFLRVVYIEQDDFREDPPKEFFRLAPGKEVRLRSPTSSSARASIKDRDRQGDGDALHLRPGRRAAATTRRTAARSRGRSTGSRPRTRSTPRCASTTRSSPSPIPTTCRRARTISANLNPESLDRAEGGVAGAEPRKLPRRATAISSSAWATSAWTRSTRNPGRRCSTAR